MGSLGGFLVGEVGDCPSPLGLRGLLDGERGPLVFTVVTFFALAVVVFSELFAVAAAATGVFPLSSAGKFNGIPKCVGLPAKRLCITVPLFRVAAAGALLFVEVLEV